MIKRFRTIIQSNKYDELFLEAGQFILSYTHRKPNEWIALFDILQLKIALISYNRLGAEGVKSRKEGYVQTEFFEYPKEILFVLNRYRQIIIR